jgi:hypothetical protein
VTPERIWKEIDIACGEKMPIPAFQSFVESDCLSTVLGTTPASLEHLPANLTIPSELDPRVILLASLLRGRPSNQALLPYDETTKRRVRTIAGRKPPLAVSLAAATTPEEQFSLCEAASNEERFIATAESPGLGELVERYNESSSSPLGISGDDLGVPHGPSIGAALRETRVALFAGRIDLSGAPAFARETAMKYLKD